MSSFMPLHSLKATTYTFQHRICNTTHSLHTVTTLCIYMFMSYINLRCCSCRHDTGVQSSARMIGTRPS